MNQPNFCIPLFLSHPENVEQAEAYLYELFRPIINSVLEQIKKNPGRISEQLCNSMIEISNDFEAGNISKHFALYLDVDIIMPKTDGARMACTRLDMILHPEKYTNAGKQ